MQQYDNNRGVLPAGTSYAAWLWYCANELGFWPDAVPLMEQPIEVWRDYHYLSATAVAPRLDFLRTIRDIIQGFAKPPG